MDVNYDPHKMWVFVNTSHCSITGARLTVITSTLHGPKQSSTDSLTTHLDNFNLVLSEYYKFSGKISETQAACLLISTLLPEYDTMVKMIYMTVKDLTIPKVSLLLLELEVQSGGWANSAVYKISTASAQSCSPSDQPIRRAKCTRAVCIGPHNCQDCFELPQNSEKKAVWIAKQEAGRAARAKARGHISTGVCGLKTVKAPSSSTASMLSFYTSLETVEMVDNSLKASATSVSDNLCGDWALLETGASHHMFHNENLFVASSIKINDNPSQRLKLAGGGVSLGFKATGTVKLRAGDGSIFALNNCLLVPELSKNLISVGALFKSNAVPFVHEGSFDNFSVVKDDLAVFNEAFVSNLMFLALDKVSTSSQ